MLSHFSRVRLFVTLWTVAHQAPLSMGFSREEYWSGLPCPLLRGFLGVASGKEPTCECRRPGFDQFLGQEDPLDEEMATHSSILAGIFP